MSYPDAFALKNSGLDAFLFAEVGTELNGSGLTLLSMLARLGMDPWAEAARWGKLSKADGVDCLTRSIVQMPLSPQSLHDAPATALRLILLLPGQIRPARPQPADPAAPGLSVLGQALPPSVRGWLPVAGLLLALLLGLAVNLAVAPRSASDTAPITRTP